MTLCLTEERKERAPPPLSNLMAMSTFSNQRNLGGFDHKTTGIQQEQLWAYLKIIESHVFKLDCFPLMLLKMSFLIAKRVAKGAIEAQDLTSFVLCSAV